MFRLEQLREHNWYSGQFTVGPHLSGIKKSKILGLLSSFGEYTKPSHIASLMGNIYVDVLNIIHARYSCSESISLVGVAYVKRQGMITWLR